MIHYNDPDYADQRKAAKPLNHEENVEVIDFINSLISKSDDENADKVELLQRFVYHFENLARQADR